MGGSSGRRCSGTSSSSSRNRRATGTAEPLAAGLALDAAATRCAPRTNCPSERALLPGRQQVHSMRNLAGRKNMRTVLACEAATCCWALAISARVAHADPLFVGCAANDAVCARLVSSLQALVTDTD